MRRALLTPLLSAALAAQLAGCASPAGTDTPAAQAAAPAPASSAPAPAPDSAPPPAAPAPVAATPAPKAAEPEARPTAAALNLREAQKRLAALGYKPGPADGKPGPRTTEALKRFQQDSGLPASGTLDVDTAQRLKAAVR